jgi:Coatomer epsilon subunit
MAVGEAMQVVTKAKSRRGQSHPWIRQNCTTSSNSSFSVRSNQNKKVCYLTTIPRPGAYKSLADSALPDPSSSDYTPILLYQARAYIALNNPKAAIQIVPADTENVSLKAVAALARYVGAGEGEKEAPLEELRDLCVEVEGEDAEGTDWEKGMVRVLSGTAFARAGEVEEALETLGAGTNTQNLEAFVFPFYLCVFH